MSEQEKIDYIIQTLIMPMSRNYFVQCIENRK